MSKFHVLELTDLGDCFWEKTQLGLLMTKDMSNVNIFLVAFDSIRRLDLSFHPDLVVFFMKFNMIISFAKFPNNIEIMFNPST